MLAAQCTLFIHLWPVFMNFSWTWMTFSFQALNQSCISCIILLHSMQHSQWSCFQTLGSHLGKFPAGRPMYNNLCLHRPGHVEWITHAGRPAQTKCVINGGRSSPAGTLESYPVHTYFTIAIRQNCARSAHWIHTSTSPNAADLHVLYVHSLSLIVMYLSGQIDSGRYVWHVGLDIWKVAGCTMCNVQFYY